METVQRGLSAAVVVLSVAAALFVGGIVVLMGLSWAVAAGSLNPGGRDIGALIAAAPFVSAVGSGVALYRAGTRGAYLIIGAAGLTIAGSFLAIIVTAPYSGGP